MNWLHTRFEANREVLEEDSFLISSFSPSTRHSIIVLYSVTALSALTRHRIHRLFDERFDSHPTLSWLQDKEAVTVSSSRTNLALVLMIKATRVHNAPRIA
jgi:hypothetical protein